jgi:putative copper export protein
VSDFAEPLDSLLPYGALLLVVVVLALALLRVRTEVKRRREKPRNKEDSNRANNEMRWDELSH